MSKECRRFVEANRTATRFRFFLIKQIVKRYGKDALANLPKNSDFSWIVPQELLAQSAGSIQDHFVVR